MPVNRMKQIEKREGKPMRDILMETYPLYDNQAGVAKAIGISQPTLSQWIIRLGLKEKTVLVPRDEGLIVMSGEAANEAIAYPREMEVVVS